MVFGRFTLAKISMEFPIFLNPLYLIKYLGSRTEVMHTFRQMISIDLLQDYDPLYQNKFNCM